MSELNATARGEVHSRRVVKPAGKCGPVAGCTGGAGRSGGGKCTIRAAIKSLVLVVLLSASPATGCALQDRLTCELTCERCERVRMYCTEDIKGKVDDSGARLSFKP